MNRIIKFGLVALVGCLVLTQVASAQISTNFFKKDGVAINFVNSTWEFGKSSLRIAKGWFNELDVTTLTVGSIVSGDLDLDSNKLIWDSDADTYYQSTVDDVVTYTIGGADDFQISINTFTALAGSNIVVANGKLELNRTTDGVVLDINNTATTYTDGIPTVDISRTGNITGGGAEFMEDVSITPNLTITDPATGIFRYKVFEADASTVSVTAAGGDTYLYALYSVASNDTDLAKSYAAYFQTQYADISFDNEGTWYLNHAGGANASNPISLDYKTNAYNDGVGLMSTISSGAITGIAGEEQVDSKIAPTNALTDPASGTFSRIGHEIDLSGLSLTGAGGNTDIYGLKIKGSTDADIKNSYVLYTEDGRISHNFDYDVGAGQNAFSIGATVAQTNNPFVNISSIHASSTADLLILENGGDGNILAGTNGITDVFAFGADGSISTEMVIGSADEIHLDMAVDVDLLLADFENARGFVMDITSLVGQTNTSVINGGNISVNGHASDTSNTEYNGLVLGFTDNGGDAESIGLNFGGDWGTVIKSKSGYMDMGAGVETNDVAYGFDIELEEDLTGVAIGIGSSIDNSDGIAQTNNGFALANIVSIIGHASDTNITYVGYALGAADKNGGSGTMLGIVQLPGYDYFAYGTRVGENGKGDDMIFKAMDAFDSGSTEYDGGGFEFETGIGVNGGDAGNFFINGQLALKRISITTATSTLTASSSYVSVMYTDTGTCTTTLPEISTLKSDVVYILKDADYNAGTNDWVIEADGGGDTIDEAATQVVSVDGTSISIIANRETDNWEIF